MAHKSAATFATYLLLLVLPSYVWCSQACLEVAEDYKDKAASIVSTKKAIIIARGIVNKLIINVVFLYKLFNSLNWLFKYSLEIAGAKTLLRLINSSVVIPVKVNNILYAATWEEGKVILIIKLSAWLDKNKIIE